MRLLKFITVVTLVACPVICSALNVPFYNHKLPPGGIIIANYSFDARHQTLVCSSASSNADTAGFYWFYKGGLKGALLSPDTHLVLKNNSQLEGSFADAVGILKIDTTLSRNTIVINCEYNSWD